MHSILISNLLKDFFVQVPTIIFLSSLDDSRIRVLLKFRIKSIMWTTSQCYQWLLVVTGSSGYGPRRWLAYRVAWSFRTFTQCCLGAAFASSELRIARLCAVYRRRRSRLSTIEWLSWNAHLRLHCGILFSGPVRYLKIKDNL